MKQYKITENNITYEIIELIGNKSYYLNKLLHREYGPAVELNNGTKHWYKNGILHRENGPAIEEFDSKQYWWNGKHIKNIYSDQEFKRYMKLICLSLKLF